MYLGNEPNITSADLNRYFRGSVVRDPYNHRPCLINELGLDYCSVQYGDSSTATYEGPRLTPFLNLDTYRLDVDLGWREGKNAYDKRTTLGLFSVIPTSGGTRGITQERMSVQTPAALLGNRAVDPDTQVAYHGTGEDIRWVGLLLPDLLLTEVNRSLQEAVHKVRDSKFRDCAVVNSQFACVPLISMKDKTHAVGLMFYESVAAILYKDGWKILLKRPMKLIGDYNAVTLR